MDALDQFMISTEETTSGISKPQNRTISYPFLFIDKITDVELAYLAQGVITQTPTGDDSLPLYLHTGGYRFLGYFNLCFSSVIKLNYFREHNLILKIDKHTSKRVMPDLFDSLLLSR